MIKILLVWLILCGSACAKDLGVFGPTYLILEMDALDWIVGQRLPELERSGEIDKMNAHLQQQSQLKIENPKGINLPKAKTHSVKYKSLIYVAPKDVLDDKGRVLFSRGTSVAPSDLLPESKRELLFIDGNKTAQVDFALRECAKNKSIKIVLVAGRPLELMRRYKITIYFDQHHSLIDKFGISNLPAKVYRQKSRLVIEELVI